MTQAMQQGRLQYVGKYNAPDYETLLTKKCQLAIESTMITHNPEVKEQLEKVNIPVLVDAFQRESHDGTHGMDKLYGLLLGKTDEAEKFFDEKVRQLNEMQAADTWQNGCVFLPQLDGLRQCPQAGRLCLQDD